MGPFLYLAIIFLVPFIGACLGFEVISKSCDCGQHYTYIMLFRVLLTHRVANTLGYLGRTRGSGSSILVPADQDTTDTVNKIYQSQSGIKPKWLIYFTA